MAALKVGWLPNIMNLAIQQCSRERHELNSNQRKTPIPNFSRIVQDLGFNDTQDLKDEAENVWAMLTDLHASDPDGYKSFVNSQMKAAAEAEKSQDSSKRHFTPEKSFVVETLVECSSLKGEFGIVRSRATNTPSLVGYVNFCYHKALETPKNTYGNNVDDSTTDITNLQVPLVISDVRQVRWREKTKENYGVAVDVVFHPWCFARWNDNDSFKNQIIDLGMKAIEEDGKLKFCTFDWNMLTTSDYKGGMGVNQNDVHLFPIEMPSRTVDDKNKNDTNDRASSGQEKESKTATVTTGIINDPSSLLQSLKSETNSENDPATPPIAITNNDKGKSNKALIQEISSESFSKIEKISRQMPLRFKKGFLSKRKGKLFDVEGSSGDGMSGTGGSLSTFVSRCQVVDVKNKGSEVSSAPTSLAITSNAEDMASSINVEGNYDSSEKMSHKKGFLEENQEREQPEKIKVRSDGGNSSSNCEAKIQNGEGSLSLGALNNLFEEANKAKFIKNVSPNLPDTCGVDRVDSQEKGLISEIPNQIIMTREGKKMILDLSKTNVNTRHDVELEVIGDNVTIKTKCGHSFYHSNPTILNPEDVTAKFQKKSKRLTIAF